MIRHGNQRHGKEQQLKNLYKTIVDKKREKPIIDLKTGKPLKAIVRGWRERNPMVWASCLLGFDSADLAAIKPNAAEILA